jgi:hypothetical protein
VKSPLTNLISVAPLGGDRQVPPFDPGKSAMGVKKPKSKKNYLEEFQI